MTDEVYDPSKRKDYPELFAKLGKELETLSRSMLKNDRNTFMFLLIDLVAAMAVDTVRPEDRDAAFKMSLQHFTESMCGYMRRHAGSKTEH